MPPLISGCSWIVATPPEGLNEIISLYLSWGCSHATRIIAAATKQEWQMRQKKLWGWRKDNRQFTMYTKELFRKDWDTEDQRAICKVIGRRKQGNGLEVPCMYCLAERQQILKKLEVLFQPNIASFCQAIIITVDLTNSCQRCSSSWPLIVVTVDCMAK